MSSFPNRCQHLKVNGTQCGSPALRRNRFCFFHKRFQDERIRLATDRKRHANAAFLLPVLEDANSIQVALMQVMRLLVSQQIDHKTASLLLYALQTASTNLRMTDFKPYRRDVILDPRDAAQSCLGESLWHDEDFEEEDDEEEETKAPADPVAAFYERKRQERIERAGKRAEAEEKLKMWVEQHPGNKLVRDEYGILKVEYQKQMRPPQPAQPPAQKKPAASTSEEEFQADIDALTRKHFFPNMPKEVAKLIDKKAT